MSRHRVGALPRAGRPRVRGPRPAHTKAHTAALLQTTARPPARATLHHSHTQETLLGCHLSTLTPCISDRVDKAWHRQKRTTLSQARKGDFWLRKCTRRQQRAGGGPAGSRAAGHDNQPSEEPYFTFYLKSIAILLRPAAKWRQPGRLGRQPWKYGLWRRSTQHSIPRMYFESMCITHITICSIFIIELYAHPVAGWRRPGRQGRRPWRCGW